MRNYMILNGKNSNEIKGLIIQEFAPITKPQMRTQVETIDGRDGDIVTPLGYASYSKKISIGLYGDFDINEVIAYFATEGEVIFSNEPDKYYKYKIIDQVDYERLIRFRVASVTMHVQPFKYSATEGTITKDASGTVSDEGSELALDNTVESPFNVFRHKGNATQETYTGKNLVPFTTQDFTLRNVRYYVQDGSLIINGASTGETSSGDAQFKANFAFTLPAGTYTASHKTGLNGVTAYVKKQSDNSNVATLAANVASASFTLAEETPLYIGLYVYQANNNNVNTEIMIEQSSAFTSYEPYVGGIPSPNPDYPQDIKALSGDSKVRIYPSDQKNIADPQDFIDWIDRTYNLCLKYTWNTDSHRPAYGAYQGREHVATFEAATLFNVRDRMINPTYDEAKRIIINTGQFKEKTRYTISFDAYVTGNGATNMQIEYTDGTYTNISAVTPNTWSKSTSISVANKTIKSIRHNYQSGTIYIDLDTLQIEEGTSPSDYEKYRGQYYQIPILGKNIINPDTMGVGYIGADGYATASAATGDMVSPYITVEPNTQYTFEIFETTSTYDNWIGYCEYGAKNVSTLIGSRHVKQNGDAFYTFTTGANTKYIRLSARNLQAATKYQLSQGERTTYEPYDALYLAGIGDYADEPVKVDGTWYIRRAIKKVVLDGSEHWGKSGIATCNHFWCDSFTDTITLPEGTGKIISPYFTERNMYTMFHNTDIYGIALSNENHEIRIAFPVDVLSTTADFKAWLAEHPTTVYYVLAEPVDEEVTGQNLIDALETMYEQVHAYKGRTHITATAQGDNAPAVLSVEVNENNESTIVNSGNTNSKPVITIYGQGDIAVYLNGIQALQIALGDEDHITIDAEQMEAYKDSLDNLKNRLVTGDYNNLSFKAGDNTIYFAGIVTKYEVENYSRWL